MIVRNIVADDIPALRKMYAESGYAYTFPDLTGPLMETVLVAVDEDDGSILGAIAAERIVQSYLLLDQSTHPAVKLNVIRRFHHELAIQLKAKNYSSLEAFLPPPIAEKFGRRLMRTFGWIKSWPCYSRNF